MRIGAIPIAAVVATTVLLPLDALARSYVGQGSGNRHSLLGVLTAIALVLGVPVAIALILVWRDERAERKRREARRGRGTDS